MSQREFLHWLALYNLEPWGERGAWLRSGMLRSFIANSFQDSSKPSIPLDKFLPEFIK